MNYYKIKTGFKNLLIKSDLISEKTLERMRKHWIRVICDEKTQKLVNGIHPEILSVLEISGKRWEKLFPFKSYEFRNYPEFDILDIDRNQNTYDLIILEHVLEHLSNPLKALQNVYKILNPKGYVLITTPFLVKVHFGPEDFSRWTKLGLKQITIDAGFDEGTIHVDQWGNQSCIKANFNRWVKYNPIIHSLSNEEKFPAIVWCLATKL